LTTTIESANASPIDVSAAASLTPFAAIDVSAASLTPFAAIAANTPIAEVLRLMSSRTARSTSIETVDLMSPISIATATTASPSTYVRRTYELDQDVSRRGGSTTEPAPAEQIDAPQQAGLISPISLATELGDVGAIRMSLSTKRGARPMRMTMTPALQQPTSSPAIRVPRMTMTPVAEAVTRLSLAMRDDATPPTGVPQRMTMADASTGRIR
jgi:hypothetical protein